MTIKHVINEGISNKQIGIIDLDGNKGIAFMDRDAALKLADEADLDLVQMSENGDTSICKLLNYSKFMYEQNKRQKESKQKQAQMKEVRFGAHIAPNDIFTKAKTVDRILSEGDRVKVSVVYKGRDISNIKNGVILLNELASLLKRAYKLDTKPTIERTRVYMVVVPS